MNLQAGDKSLATVVAHEISHSWTGNLVTNANYEHFWLNEGFTKFLEGKIAGKMFGKEARDFHAIQGISGMQDEVIENIYFFSFLSTLRSTIVCNVDSNYLNSSFILVFSSENIIKFFPFSFSLMVN